MLSQQSGSWKVTITSHMPFEFMLLEGLRGFVAGLPVSYLKVNPHFVRSSFIYASFYVKHDRWSPLRLFHGLSLNFVGIIGADKINLPFVMHVRESFQQPLFILKKRHVGWNSHTSTHGIFINSKNSAPLQINRTWWWKVLWFICGSSFWKANGNEVLD